MCAIEDIPAGKLSQAPHPTAMGLFRGTIIALIYQILWRLLISTIGRLALWRKRSIIWKGCRLQDDMRIPKDMQIFHDRDPRMITDEEFRFAVETASAVCLVSCVFVGVVLGIVDTSFWAPVVVSGVMSMAVAVAR